MTAAPYELIPTPAGVIARIHSRGSAVLGAPTLNRGTAFTPQQREALGLTGLLPTGVTTLDGQLRAILRAGHQPAQMGVPGHLRDRNEVLFYRLLTEHLSEMLPVVYTPRSVKPSNASVTSSAAPAASTCSSNRPEDIETALRNTGLRPGDVDLLVTTDSESILGIGDQGIGGIEIAIGKAAI